MRILSFSTRLFLSIILLFWIFVCCFVYYQYLREKHYKAELLNTRLTAFNQLLDESLKDSDSTAYVKVIRTYSQAQDLTGLRVTVMDGNGHVRYDNDAPSVDGMENHLKREEVQKALQRGSAYAIKRNSATLGKPYFYAATYFKEDGIIVRSALPYDLALYQLLQADLDYIWFTLAVTFVLSLIFYNLTGRLGATITRLRRFARKADEGGNFDLEPQSTGDNELDQIANHIIDMYKRLQTTKDDLFLAHEKLIGHLQISNEGLAVFNPGREVILSNALFMQYANLISDRNLSTMDEVFSIKELEPLTDFITTAGEDTESRAVQRRHFTLDKNGYIFSITGVVFYDGSFEISIFDVTRQEEQAQLKRQLTQNVAHELKTPVSSIQGYLETLLNTPDLAEPLREQFLTRCFAQSNRLTNLLRDITALTRLDDAAGMIDVATVNLKAVIETICADLALALKEKQMSVHCILPEQIVLQGNESLLDSVFRNLMDNAIAYAGAGSRIEINCFFDDEENYYFSFKDNGIGVAPEHLSRLFERFYRVDKGRSRKMGGTGLGLAIVKNAVLFHGGAIHAKVAKGGGLEFVFNLKKVNPKQA